MEFLESLRERTRKLTDKLKVFILDLKEEARYTSEEQLVENPNKFFLPYDLFVNYIDLSAKLKEIMTSWEILLNRYMPKYTRTLAETFYLDLLRLHGTINKYLLSIGYKEGEEEITWYFHRGVQETLTDFDLLNQCRKTLETLTTEKFPLETDPETLKIVVDSSDDSRKFMRKNGDSVVKIDEDTTLDVENHHVNKPGGRYLAESNDIYRFPALIMDGTVIQGLGNLSLKKYVKLMQEENPHSLDEGSKKVFKTFLDYRDDLIKYAKESMQNLKDNRLVKVETLGGEEIEASPDYAFYETVRKMRAIYPSLRKDLANYYFNFSRSNPKLFVSYPLFLLSTNKLIEATAGGNINKKIFRMPPDGWLHFTRLIGTSGELESFINLYGKINDTGYRGDKIIFVGHINCISCHGMDVSNKQKAKKLTKNKRMKGLFDKKNVKKLVDKSYKGVKGDIYEWGGVPKQTKMAERLWLTILPDEESTQTLTTPYCVWASRGSKFGLGTNIEDIFDELFGEFKEEIIKKAEERRKRRRPYGRPSRKSYSRKDYSQRKERERKERPKRGTDKTKKPSENISKLKYKFEYTPGEAAKKLRRNGLTYFQIRESLQEIYNKSYSRNSVKEWCSDVEKGSANE